MTATTVEQDLDANGGPPAPRRRRHRLRWLALGVVVAAAAGAVGYWVSTQGDGGAPIADTAAGPVATAEVARETISDTRDFNGILGHGSASTVTTSGQGIVTGIADQGTEVERGTELFRLNEQPVTALFGAVPMYRDLQHGSTGIDVEQLITNLTELGYADCEAEDEFTACVEVAVRDWQDDIGADETGSVAQTDVVFVPEGSRVDTIHTGVGSVVAPGAAVLDLTGSDQVVSLEAHVRDRDLLMVDTEVSVQLPGGDEVAGTVTAANVVPVEPEGGGAGGGGDEAAGSEDSVAKVEVTLEEAVDEALLGANADVVIEVDEREDVLTVPVNALLALSEGGHGVEVVTSDEADGTAMTSTIVPVETGLFADGKVEITGDGIDAGTVVGVAGR